MSNHGPPCFKSLLDWLRAHACAPVAQVAESCFAAIDRWPPWAGWMLALAGGAVLVSLLLAYWPFLLAAAVGGLVHRIVAGK